MTAHRFHVRRRGSAVALAAIVALAASTVGSVQQADAKPRLGMTIVVDSNSGGGAYVDARACDTATRPGTRFRYTTTVRYRSRVIGQVTRVRRSGPKRCALLRANFEYSRTVLNPEHKRAVVRVQNLTTGKATAKRVRLRSHG